MKTIYMLLPALLMTARAISQVQEIAPEKNPLENIDNTLKAANSMCVISFIYEAGGAVLLLSGSDKSNYKLGFGLALGIGGIGMATNNAILASRAYNQIKQMKFTTGDSLLHITMLRDIKTARTLSIIQNLIPVIGVAAGAINWVVSKPDHPAGELYRSSLFWIPTISICAIGVALTIPEMLLIAKTRRNLETYRQRLVLGSTGYGMGIRYKF